jgi:hypothetical protein
MPSNSFDYRLRSSDQNDLVNTPRFAFLNNSGNASVTDATMQLQCVIEFDIPANITPSVLLYYKLTNFYQNHRRYVQSYDANQLKGQFRSASTLGNSNCKPLGTLDGKPIYPCGLIANSIFNGLYISFLFLHDIFTGHFRYIFRSCSTESNWKYQLIGTNIHFLVNRHCVARRSQKICFFSHRPYWRV